MTVVYRFKYTVVKVHVSAKTIFKNGVNKDFH